MKSFIIFFGRFPEYPHTSIHDINIDMFCLSELTRSIMKKSPLDKIIQMIREDAPTNAMAHGKIAGSAEAGDDPPVRKKRKRIMHMVVTAAGESG